MGQGAFQYESVERTDAAHQKGVHRATIGGRGNGFDGVAGGGEIGDAAFEATNFPLKITGCRAKNSPVFWPIRGKIGRAQPQAIAGSADHRDEDEDHDQSADGARNPKTLQEIHRGIEEIGDEHGEKQGNNHARGVVEKEKNDGSREDAQAKSGAGDAKN